MAGGHHHHHNGGSSSKRPRSSTGDMNINNNNNNNDQGGSSKRQRTETHAQDAQPLDPLGYPNVDAFGHPQLDYNNYVAPMATMQQYNMPPPTAAATSAGNNPAAPNGVSSYGAAYQGPLPANATRSTRSGLRIGALTLEEAQLAIPGHLSPEDKAALKARLQDELNRQRAHPPALPRSEIPDLPPKEFMPEYKKIEEHFAPALKARIRTFNARVSEELRNIDRRRNNQAAKKSRETRLEALRLTRDMLNKKTAECDWLRLKVLQLQGDPKEYDALPGQTRRRLIETVETRVREVDQAYAEEKKQEESRKRAQRTRLRAEAREIEAMAPDHFLNEIVPPEEALTAIIGEDGTYIDKGQEEEDGEGEQQEQQQVYGDGGGVLDEHVLERTLYGGGHNGHTM
ncbi:uncharacterized protein F5Z01DRAFT_511806 [Emericellopsis atlantica]|uniref:BZIP domain-containing protein n=1 Tax=Emericellopsis atlantica TaxID=2614577 RepID=A0A9P7ZQI2_9HYPO|nr:uncharacterized protein F5Z01DRAFT_511806 [Emericellopsis atlantica]KAG9256474.1 hypothetical protein F5Z01DRAFT_511806 [Emericellopsis atlantica]